MRTHLLMLMASLVVPATVLAQGAPAAPPAGPAPRPLILLTTAFPDGGVIPDRYTQAGDQTSPALAWLNVPAGTVSFVLHMRDPDVARNRSTEEDRKSVV